MSASCELCQHDGGRVLWREPLLRVLRVEDPEYPGMLRVVCNAHVREMTDLPLADRERIMQVVFAVEAVLRRVLAPHKINLASLGNVTPHLHWHVVPRFADDAHFPQPIWGARQRDPDGAALAQRATRLADLERSIVRELGAGGPAPIR